MISNTEKKIAREVVSTTGQRGEVCSIQHVGVWHSTGEVKYNVNSTFLYGFYVAPESVL